MGAGYWGEKPKKKPINKLDPNRIDENDESKESYKMNNRTYQIQGLQFLLNTQIMSK